MTYKQAFDKITEAYIKGEIKPYDSCFCFCGTLCNNSPNWAKDSYRAVRQGEPHHNYGDYTGLEYTKMEQALLLAIDAKPLVGPVYEDALFAGMCAALEVLKEIHKERGENVETVEFKKRELV